MVNPFESIRHLPIRKTQTSGLIYSQEIQIQRWMRNYFTTHFRPSVSSSLHQRYDVMSSKIRFIQEKKPKVSSLHCSIIIPIIYDQIQRDPETGNSKGFAFINYASFEASDVAIDSMNGQYLCNRAISISYAFKKDSKGERHGRYFEYISNMIPIIF